MVFNVKYLIEIVRKSPFRKLPLWKGIPVLFLFLLTGILLGEMIGRTFLKEYFPLPSVGVDSFVFDVKVASLENFIDESGQLDCLLVGDSMVNNGLDPILIEDAYQKMTGSSLHCFNFGIPALTLDASGPVAAALAKRFQPRLLIFLLSPRDFVPKYGQIYRHVSKSDWVMQNLGYSSLKGWLVNHSYSYRYLLLFQYWLQPENRATMLEAMNSISKEGYWRLEGFRTPSQEYVTQPDYYFWDSESQTGLAYLLNLQDDGIAVLMVDVPVRSDYYQIYLESPENYEEIFLLPLDNFLLDYGIPFWSAQKIAVSIPDSAWHDPIHVNQEGVPVFSAWLGHELAVNYAPEYFK